VTERDAFAGRARGLEEEYFRKREQELIEKLRSRAAAEAELQRLGEQSGVADEEILQDLRDLGYTPETVMLLHLVPLVQMAWAEGGVSDRERALIVEAARARGVEPGSPADQKLAEWLTSRPSERFFERTLRAIRAFLEACPAEEREASRRELLSYSTPSRRRRVVCSASARCPRRSARCWHASAASWSVPTGRRISRKRPPTAASGHRHRARPVSRVFDGQMISG
jgi:hypothetical protein